MAHAGRIARFLGVHAEVDEVHDDLDMAEGLELPAHDAVAEEGHAVLGDEAGDDGVEGPFAGGVGVGVALFEVEELAPVLEAEAQVAGRHAAAHAAVVALDEAHHVAFAVGGGEVDGIAFLQGRVARLQAARGAVADEGPALGGVVLREQPGERHLHEGGIGVELGPVLEGQLLGLREEVRVLRAAEGDLREVVAFEDVQHLEGRDALAVGRQLPHVVAAVVDADGLHPVRVVGGQVLVAEEAAVGLHVGIDLPGDLALVEGVAALLGQELQRLRQAGVAEDLPAHRAALAVHREGLQEARVLAQHRHAAVPVVGDELGDREALLGVLDGRRQHLRHGQPAELPVQLEPAVHAAGHAHGQGALGGDVLEAELLEVVEGEGLRRAPAAVEAVELLRLRVPHDGEEVAPHAASRGLHEAQGRVRRDGGVHGGAALLEDVQGDLGDQGLARAGHAVLGRHLGARGEGPARDAIAGQQGEGRQGKDEA